MGLRGWVKRMERDAHEEMIVIPQTDGTVKRFPLSAAREAFLQGVADVGEDDPRPEHPLITAAKNSPDQRWRNSFYAGIPDPGGVVEDLSEP